MKRITITLLFVISMMVGYFTGAYVTYADHTRILKSEVKARAISNAQLALEGLKFFRDGEIEKSINHQEQMFCGYLLSIAINDGKAPSLDKHSKNFWLDADRYLRDNFSSGDNRNCWSNDGHDKKMILDMVANLISH